MSRGLGEILVKIGVIDQVQMAAGISRMEQWGGNLLGHLVQARMVSEDVLVAALAERFRYDVAHPLPLLIERTVLELLPGEFCEKFVVMPIAVRPDDSVVLAVSDPSDLATLDAVRAKVGRQVAVAVAGPKSLADAIQSHYFGGAQRSGTPDPFSAGADSFGAEALLPQAGGPSAAPGAIEIELPPDNSGLPELEPVSVAGMGNDYLPAEAVAPRQVTGSGYLSDESEVVDVGDIFADHSAVQSEDPVAGQPPRLATPGAPADDVETDEPDPAELAAARAAIVARRGNEMPTGELPLQSGDMPQAIQSTEGDLLVVAAEAVSEKAAERVQAQKSAVAHARAAAAAAAAAAATTAAAQSPSDTASGAGGHVKTVVFGTPISPGSGEGSPLAAAKSSSEAAAAMAEARSISPPLSDDSELDDAQAVIAARCDALELRLSFLNDLLVKKGVLDKGNL